MNWKIRNKLCVEIRVAWFQGTTFKTSLIAMESKLIGLFVAIVAVSV